MNKPGKTRKWFFVVSLLFNILFILGWLLNWISEPTYRLGVLTRDVNAGALNHSDTIFRIPKGITVRDVSPRGIGAIGQFENNRFEIVISTDQSELVNYNVAEDSLFPFGNYYSADNPSGNAR